MEPNVVVSNALERIENPILIILLVVVLTDVVVLWRQYQTLQNRMMELLVQNVQVVTNLNATLANMSERLESVEERLTSLEK